MDEGAFEVAVGVCFTRPKSLGNTVLLTINKWHKNIINCMHYKTKATFLVKNDGVGMDLQCAQSQENTAVFVECRTYIRERFIPFLMVQKMSANKIKKTS